MDWLCLISGQRLNLGLSFQKKTNRIVKWDASIVNFAKSIKKISLRKIVSSKEILLK